METKFQTSFIPRKPLIQNPSEKPKTSHGTGIGFLTLVSFVIFGVSVLSGILVIGWQKLENTSISKNKEQLELNKKQFGDDIEFLKRFNTKISLSKSLIDKHTSPVALFKTIEDITAEKVRYSKLTYTSSDEGLIVEAEGEAANFETLASQSDIFSQTSLISNPIINDLKLTDTGSVDFSLNITIPWSSISYKNTLVEPSVEEAAYPIQENE